MSSWDYSPLTERPEAQPWGRWKIVRISVLSSLVLWTWWAFRPYHHEGWRGADALLTSWADLFGRKPQPYEPVDMKTVLLSPGPPGLLQAPPPSSQSQSSCLFLYGDLLAQEGEVSRGVTRHTRDEGRVYGMLIDEQTGLGYATGRPQDVVKGRMLCWEASGFLDKALARAESLTQDQVGQAVQWGRGRAAVVRRDSSTRSASLLLQSSSGRTLPMPKKGPSRDYALVFKGPSRDYALVFKATPECEAVCTDKHDPNATLSKYMQLPVDQTFLSVDLPMGSRMERVGGSMFRLIVPSVKILQFEARPVLYAEIQQRSDAIVLVSNKLVMEGSESVRSLTDRFYVDAVSTIQWQDSPGRPKRITCKAVTDIRLDPPPPFNLLPKAPLEATGQIIVKSFTFVQASFVKSLAKDYARWASDPAYRAAKAMH
eukprot:g13499.t1